MKNEFIPSHLRRTWAQIDLDAAEYNFKELSRIAGGRKTFAVIKADAYGHGAVRLARLYSELGADFFAVSNLSEALELRGAGIREPILILGFIDPASASVAADFDISLSVYSLPYARALSEVLSGDGKSVKIHLKFDTGMGRIGFIPEETGENALPDALSATALDGLVLDGAFTHFAVADGGDDCAMTQYTENQARRFDLAMNYLALHGVNPRIKHVSNSAATLDYPELCRDAVRLGISLYGLAPSFDIKNSFRPRPVMTLKSVISHIKNIAEGTPISYGCTFVAPKPMRVATVPIGYADGFFRSSSPRGVRLTVRGKDVPIVGRVCMDQLMIDLTDTDAELFDTVSVFGEGAYESADSFAGKNATIGYEAVCAVARRVPRIYIRNGRIDSISDRLN